MVEARVLGPDEAEHRHRDGHAERVGGVEGGERRADLEHLAVGGVRPHQRLDVIDQVLVPAHRRAAPRRPRSPRPGCRPRRGAPRTRRRSACPPGGRRSPSAGSQARSATSAGTTASARRARARPGGCRSAATERRRGVTPRRAARRGGCQGNAGGPRRSRRCAPAFTIDAPRRLPSSGSVPSPRIPLQPARREFPPAIPEKRRPAPPPPLPPRGAPRA